MSRRAPKKRIDSALVELLRAGRPREREECADVPRPCPYVSCRHHLYLDVNHTGAIKINYKGVDVLELEESCSLDVAERGPLTLKEVGEVLRLTRERIRQIEVRGLAKLGRLRDEYED